MSLSSVVSNLVRAQMGASVDSKVTDEDLDRHIAELIVREAKAKAERYKTDGVRAYLRRGAESDAPRTNKRFLSSIIRSTDDHNKAILQAQAEAAAEVKAAREEQEREERRSRAREAAEASKRLVGGSHRRVEGDRRGSSSRSGKLHDRSWERRERLDEGQERRRRAHGSRSFERADGREDDRRRPRSNSPARKHDSTSRRHHRSDARSRSPRRRHEDSEQRTSSHRDSKDSKRLRRSRSRSVDRESSRKRSRQESPHRSTTASDAEDRESKRQRSANPQDDSIHREADLRRRVLEERKKGTDEPSDRRSHKRARSRTRSASPPSQKRRSKGSTTPPLASSQTTHTTSDPSPRSRSISPIPSRSATPGPDPLPGHNLPSKMDKYFDDAYDPRLDVAPLAAAPVVPKTGLVDGAEFEGWESMLALIRQRREDKEEKRRLQKLGFLDKDGKPVGKSKDRSADLGKWGEGAGWNSREDIMEIEYKKRGQAREWDVGKDMSF